MNFSARQLSITCAAVVSFSVCSAGMLVFNKLAVTVFPAECVLVALQMAFAVCVMLCCWPTLRIGSVRDVLRWSIVVPFFVGSVLTGILSLKNMSMTLIVVFRVLSPLVTLAAERMFPNPVTITWGMVCSVIIMISGVTLYVQGTTKTDFTGFHWVILNMFFLVGNRLTQRLFLAKDQYPVDISLTGTSLLNNLEGLIMVCVAAWATDEFVLMPMVWKNLTIGGAGCVAMSCVVGAGLSFTGMWTQSLISATSFLVVVNVNKFAIIFIEGKLLGTQHLSFAQAVGACVAILGGIIYGMTRVEAEKRAVPAGANEERAWLIGKVIQDKPSASNYNSAATAP